MSQRLVLQPQTPLSHSHAVYGWRPTLQVAAPAPFPSPFPLLVRLKLSLYAENQRHPSKGMVGVLSASSSRWCTHMHASQPDTKSTPPPSSPFLSRSARSFAAYKRRTLPLLLAYSAPARSIQRPSPNPHPLLLLFSSLPHTGPLPRPPSPGPHAEGPDSSRLSLLQGPHGAFPPPGTASPAFCLGPRAGA